MSEERVEPLGVRGRRELQQPEDEREQLARIIEAADLELSRPGQAAISGSALGWARRLADAILAAGYSRSGRLPEEPSERDPKEREGAYDVQTVEHTPLGYFLRVARHQCYGPFETSDEARDYEPAEIVAWHRVDTLAPTPQKGVE